MDTVRQRALREQRALGGVPTPHQVNAVLADAIGLTLADPEIRDTIAGRLGHHLRRALRARDLDPRAPATKRALAIRMRPNPRILEIEADERIRAEVAAMSDARRQATLAETLTLLDSLRDD